MRPIWAGAIGFGLVNIPVRLYGATDESTIPFVSLDKQDHARIRYKKVNGQTGKEVPFQNIIKGYALGKEMVIVDEEDIRRATPEKYDHLAIMQFVKEQLDQILVLHRLRFPEEIRDAGEINIPYTTIKDAEIKMAVSLIDQLTQSFNPKNLRMSFPKND